jgi:alginate O-acetyltransferase complex protein AlgI
MTFNSAIFCVFILVFAGPYYALRSWRLKKIWLLLGGLVFYGWFNPRYLALVFLSTTIDFLCVGVIARSSNDGRRRAALITSVTMNLGVLATFKYFDFFVANVAGILRAIGVGVTPPTLSLVLPIGISFYTFEAISYAVDVYKRRTTPARSYLDLLLFITFFPHLVSGPIVRARDFLPQLETPRKVTLDAIIPGLQWVVVGYFFKIGVADNLASSVEHVFAAPESASTTEAWLGTFYFAIQIFGDFAGYTMIARGLAKLMGFDLTPNFDFPYLARGFSDFWKRWHISLSSWLRDYLYISLGGNRGGRFATYRNLMLTMLLGGLWHGAAWTFVIWGGLHGTYLVVEHALRSRNEGKEPPRESVPRDLARIAFTFLLVLIAWVFFRATSVASALAVLRAMFFTWKLSLPTKMMLKDGIWIIPMAGYYGLAYLEDRGVKFATPPIRRGMALGFLAFVTIVCREVSDAFIYFQF